jgi:hypothetical protein
MFLQKIIFVNAARKNEIHTLVHFSVYIWKFYKE